MNFNVIVCEKCVDMVSDSSLQSTFKKLSPVELLGGIQEYPQLSEKAIKIFL